MKSPTQARSTHAPPKRLLYWVVALLPFGRILDRPILESAGKEATLAPLEIFLFLCAGVYSWGYISRGQLPGRGVPGFKAIAIFPLWCLVSLLFNEFRYGLSASETAFSGLYLVRWVAYALLYFVTYEVASDDLQIRRLTDWVLWGGVAFAAFGMLQVIFLPPDFALYMHPNAIPYLDWDPQGRRLVSTLYDPNIAAGFILIPTLITISFCIHGYRRWAGPMLLLLVALISTLSRSAIAGLLAGAAFLIWTSDKYRKAMMKALAIGSVLLLIASPILIPALDSFNKLTVSDESSQVRLFKWLFALNAIRHNLVFGIGFNTFGYVWSEFGPERTGGTAFGMENDLLMILILSGLAGFAIYFRIYRLMFKTFGRVARRRESEWSGALARGVSAATLGAITTSFFTNLILYPHGMAVLWILWALCMRIENEGATRESTSLALQTASARTLDSRA